MLVGEPLRVGKLSTLLMPEGSGTSTDKELSTSSRTKEASCIPHFDALWFCYCESLRFAVAIWRVGWVMSLVAVVIHLEQSAFSGY